MKADVGVGQGSALSPILSSLYLAPLLFRFDSLPGRAVLLSYVDDVTILVQSKTWNDNLRKLTNAYQHVFDFAESMGLVLEHSKSEVSHFSRSSREVNPLIDLGYTPFTGDTPLVSKDIWRYLGFFFDCALTMSEHMQWYSNKDLFLICYHHLGLRVRV